jgi:hypothetical protein
MSKSTESTKIIFRKALCYGYICGIPLGFLYLCEFWGFPEICVEWDTNARRVVNNSDLMICFYIQIAVLLLFGSSHLLTCHIGRKTWDDDSFVLLDMISLAVGVAVWLVIGTLIFCNLVSMLVNCNEFNSWLLALAISDFFLLTALGTFVIALAICIIIILFACIFLICRDICGGFIPTKPNYDVCTTGEEKV